MNVIVITKKKPTPKPIPRWMREPIARELGLPTVLYIKLTIKEIRDALGETYPPILTLEQAAEIAHLSPGTIKRKCSEGFFKESAKRGKSLRFWRDKFVQELMA